MQDLGADPSLTNQEPLVDQILDRPPHRRARQAVVLGELYLVAQADAGRE